MCGKVDIYGASPLKPFPGDVSISNYEAIWIECLHRMVDIVYRSGNDPLQVWSLNNGMVKSDAASVIDPSKHQQCHISAPELKMLYQLAVSVHADYTATCFVCAVIKKRECQ